MTARPCSGADCDNAARPTGRRCWACVKRDQRKRKAMGEPPTPRQSKVETLLAAALSYADAAAEDQAAHARAKAALLRAARRTDAVDTSAPAVDNG